MLFAVCCTTKVSRRDRALFDRCYVLHESDLPKGRGWSPLAWQVIRGRKEIKVSLIEMVDKIDSGPICAQSLINLEGHELWDEIHERAAEVKIDLIRRALYGRLYSLAQRGRSSYYSRRSPEDSRINPGKSIESQFDAIRIADPRFPPFFDLRGHRYRIRIEKCPTPS